MTQEKLVILHSRIKKEQSKFIKDMAQKESKTEGQVLRELLDNVIKNHE